MKPPMNLTRHAWLCLAALAACAPAQWDRAGATSATMNNDLQDCRVQSRLSPEQRVGPLGPRGGGTPAVDRMHDRDAQEAREIESCMLSKGYRLK